MLQPPLPYCGAPPSPDLLWGRWNLDPVLLAALALIYGLYELGARRAGLPRGRRMAFAAGWTATVLPLVSPLCALAVSLFAARVGQHMFLVVVAAPLVAWGRPAAAVRALIAAFRKRGPSPRYAPLLAASALLTGVACWHAPGPYALTFASPVAYWAMHLTLFGSAVWLWAELLDPKAQLTAVAPAIGLATLGMSLIGAVITLAPRPLYGPHLLTTSAWGLTPLEDQQVGGALMWAPAGVIMAAALVAGLAQVLVRAERMARERSAA